jgi:hypothetical protein
MKRFVYVSTVTVFFFAGVLLLSSLFQTVRLVWSFLTPPPKSDAEYPATAGASDPEGSEEPPPPTEPEANPRPPTRRGPEEGGKLGSPRRDMLPSDELDSPSASDIEDFSRKLEEGGISSTAEQNVLLGRGETLDVLTREELMKRAADVEMVKEGGGNGLRVTHIRSGSVLDRMGLEEGDVIVEVAGVDSRSLSPGVAERLRGQYEALGFLPVQVVRNGQRRTIQCYLR